MEFLGYFLALLVGVSLGLIGSGGSILTLPILVYLMGVDPILATAYSLFVVGITALVGGINNALQGQVHFKSVVIFGLPSIVAVYLTRTYLLPFIPETIFQWNHFTFSKSMALMILFAVVMILASVAMIKPCKNCSESENSTLKYNYPMILLEGLIVGVLTGLVGAGGGFLIIPALVLLARMPMKLAVGTSLFIIAIKSLLGFLGDLQTSYILINWRLLLYFTLLSVIGIFIGMLLAKKIKGNRLKTAFGWFVLIMGTYILIKELMI
ncbi:sulfite exporter TauE/SafE family protein [Capnocytophaga canimorsus]|uniref:sulfite exporter TauE/SafE family protein n=1 Tax=Capnocytophaga canimorsus TaxID=28188 RepID=UPI000F4F90A4|nr:sulfite exporter TauE/SafE family protein [Capnocytophaga canimorsus]AYW36598.1 sulfite exporter TauE/SafE family protein [Capnocytophaga canimorsus]